MKTESIWLIWQKNVFLSRKETFFAHTETLFLIGVTFIVSFLGSRSNKIFEIIDCSFSFCQCPLNFTFPFLGIHGRLVSDSFKLSTVHIYDSYLWVNVSLFQLKQNKRTKI